MRRLFAALCAVLFALTAAHAEEAPRVLYFYENICETCTPEEDFLAEYERLTGEALDMSRLEGHNVFHAAGRRALEETARALDLPLETVKLPMAVIGGVAYMGTTALRGKLPRDALSSSQTGTDTLVLYLYLPACESCRAAEAALSALPESIPVKRGSLAFDSAVTVRKIDLSADPETAFSLFEQYAVPDTERVAPIVFLGAQYLSGAEAIQRSLSALVRAGRGIGTLAPQSGPKGAPLSGWSVGGALAAGLVGGLNPCALSMLLLFLSTLLTGNRRTGRYAIAFLLSKLLCYLAIGTALLGLLQRLNPVWLLPVSRWVLTAAGGALAALNLWDAWQARQGALGRVRNQLPRGMRGYLRRVTAALMKNPALLLPAVCLLGVLIAAGEFLCAGQVYLAGLLAALQSGAGFAPLFTLLLLYCAAFLAPSAALCALVARTGRAMAASAFLAARMAAVKLLTALMMLLLIAAAWLL